ncbi:hypothetical protein K227x_00660 [Rubripirellula lacrimiformis]|uniref:DUF3828 domain-containing protein n=1 Tax=Rubripirellula lacrimiformis TaxID=1930273 RepID=A0A517N3I5_9BACT|nr:hypothetical protein [Rubripirellula lacrimiformis]QDT01699.1 hypothetical protein K227x_00660 [Rubripirellula lacrimiformis]
MDRFASSFALIVLLSAVGCGSKESGTATATPANSSPSGQTTAAATGVTDPSNVVAQFLDRVRRGGEDSGAGELLTQRAQSELRRIGRSVQPIGTPDARFSVTRAEMVPDEPNAALVHTIWTEPNADGSQTETQVVWAMQKEASEWRISGMAMEMDPNQDPLIIDFENGQRMAQMLDGPATDQPGDVQAAEAPAADTIAR